MKIAVMLITAAVFILVCLLHFLPQINYRSMPGGLLNGTLDDSKPNWVSSQVQASNKHHIEALQVKHLGLLADCLLSLPFKTTLVRLDENTLIAYRQSRVFNFTDWIRIDKQGQVTSSATMGYYDFGKNRQWVEFIRSRCLTNHPS